ncbi:SAM-dependent methyltransferase [Histidinibacterium lentulum]|uniref:Class I SAM-dependent methyltransferase n=1 Tax=Histidinibacterium lentulum TaxID=2480588 RepID=A0A3N2RAN8_9RHOB|nr:class I SAM-dependent methyltransferase [Histidinibacterium lentulum]ROU04416.1 class I SAM-dependent methyltransferase [Histidinibacterium lentulum]
MASDFWNERYAASEGYLFGTEPAAFLAAQAAHLPPGSEVLCVADGEGRNSVWLAARGHRVTAFDAAAAGVERARALAAERGAEVAHEVATIEGWDWTRPFDAVVAIFIQFLDPAAREAAFVRLGGAVRPGGLLLLHGYAPRQVGYGTGGPPAAENMYTEELLAAAFAGWEILRLADYDAEIHEGRGHSGRSALVDLVARKPG